VALPITTVLFQEKTNVQKNLQSAKLPPCTSFSTQSKHGRYKEKRSSFEKIGKHFYQKITAT
jgi:hypothetical protein